MLRTSQGQLIRLASSLFMLLGLGTWNNSLEAQLPVARLTAIFPTGGQVGSEVEVNVSGTDLDQVESLSFSHPGITAKPKMEEPGPFDQGPQPVEGVFLVSIAKNVPAGLYEVRATGKYGITDPRRFAVSTLADTLEVEPNDKLEEAQELTLPAILNGSCGKSADIDHFSFSGKRGQSVLLECWGFRLDSRLEPTLTLLDPRGRELERNRNFKHRDAVIVYTLPADGVYVIKLRDSVYRGGDEYPYRLQLTEGPHIDYIFPPVAEAGKTGTFQLYGRNLPGGKEQPDLKLNGAVLQRLDVKITAPAGEATTKLDFESVIPPEDTVLDGFSYRFESPQGVSNPIFISFASEKVVAEQEPNNSLEEIQTVQIPCEVVGQFYPRRDRDRYSFTAKKGEEIWIEVISQRLGISADPVLIVQQITQKEGAEEQVRELVRLDDPVATERNGNQMNANIGGLAFNTTTDDPAYRLIAPADGEYRVIVRDLYSSSQVDPRFVYRLALRRAQPDFRLVAMAPNPGASTNPTGNPAGQWSLNLRKGGAQVIEVYAFRRDGFSEPIEVTIEGLPKGVTCEGATIGQEGTIAPLVLRADAGITAWRGEVRISGQAMVAGKKLTRQARPATCVWSAVNNQSASHVRLAESLMLSLNPTEEAPYTIAAGDGKPLATARGGKLEFPVKVTGLGDIKNIKGNINLAAHPMPTNVRVQNVNVAVNKSADYVITLPTNSAVGTYTLYLQGRVQVSYIRNPEAAEAAKQRKEELDKIVVAKTEENKQATTAKTTADSAATAATQKLTTATTAVKTAEAAVKAAQAVVAGAEQKLKAAADAATKGPEDAALKKAQVAAEAVLNDANTAAEKSPATR